MYNKLPLWPITQKFKFNKYKKKADKHKIDYIENFFKKKYNSKYCVLTSSARVGIILALKYKKFDRSKIFNIPVWSSHCLYNSIGYVSNITCKGNDMDGALLVHHLGQSFQVKSKKIFLIDDSSDSLPEKEFKACINSTLLEVISLPKIIGSYCGGLVLTNNYNFYYYLKTHQMEGAELANLQSQKKYNCLVLKKKNFEWHYSELENYGMDHNTCENIFENLKNFEINLLLLKKRKQLFLKYVNGTDKYRVGPCIIMQYKEKNEKIFESYHINVKKKLEKQIYLKRHILPLHFSITDKEIEKKLNALSRR